ncbi:aspartyl/glutamyl-tRNA amidotransferase subunit C [Sesbania bispinosa]|nr:aspartyl/glutamyl-tRNA amidotransferase subunit C [Sesbania bispinosa]
MTYCEQGRSHGGAVRDDDGMKKMENMANLGRIARENEEKKERREAGLQACGEGRQKTKEASAMNSIKNGLRLN